MDASRRRLFSPGLPQQTPSRPPGALAEADFLARCTRCGACTTACQTQGSGVISAGPGTCPSLNFNTAACTFCEACITACPAGALLPAPHHHLGVAQLDHHCLSAQGITCRTCGDFCEAGAIRFVLRPGGVSLGLVDPDRCNGCGACVAPCPVGAIRIQALAHPHPHLHQSTREELRP